MPRATNENLLTAQAHPDDEFYTPRTMIEAELQHYPVRLFKDKRILCNCDDPDYSEFFRYFADNFGKLKLRRLVGLRYSGSQLPFVDPADKAKTWRAARYQVPSDKNTPPFKRTLFTGKNGKKCDTGKCELSGGDTGGFADREGLRQLKNCDIVVTNPPFSRFRDFIELVVQSKKKFIIIGNINAVGYKHIFPLIHSGKVWLGAGPRVKGAFIRPKIVSGKDTAPAAACWYTNMSHNRRMRDEIKLKAKYTAADYPAYDNYPAIEVKYVRNIPADYDGEMGVPRSFIEKHNPRQFKIVGKMRFPRPGWDRVPELCVRGRPVADRFLIVRASAADDWMETKDLDHRALGGAAGFVYVATIPGDRGWYKIGKTNGSVAERVKRDAFNRKPPKVVMALMVHNAGMAEKQIHKALHLNRKKGTEFFNPSCKELEEVLSRLAQKPIRLWK